MGYFRKLLIRASQDPVTIGNHDNAETSLFAKALLNHIKIASFKDLQRQFTTGKQHQRQGK